jgi:hypothetical protein
MEQVRQYAKKTGAVNLPFYETTADKMQSGDFVQIANCRGRFQRIVWALNVRNADDGTGDIVYRLNSREAQVPRNRAVRIYNMKTGE